MFYGYTCFWFYFVDNPLQLFVTNTVNSYKNLSLEDFTITLRIAFLCFLFNVLIKIRRNYRSFKTFINKKEDTTTNSSLTKIEENTYKIDFVINNQPSSIIVRKSTEYDNIEGIYTYDYEDCVTSDVKPFFAFYQDRVHPRYINKIYDRKETCLIITYKNGKKRTIITDEGSHTEENGKLLEEETDSCIEDNGKLLEEEADSCIEEEETDSCIEEETEDKKSF